MLINANLHNYFNHHICPSHGVSGVGSWRLGIPLPIPVVESQTVTNKRSLLYVKNEEKYAFLVTLRTLRSLRQGGVELCKVGF